MKNITWGPTPRRLTAAKRALKKQRDKCPLFADQIAASQPTPEGRIKYYDDLRLKRMKYDRIQVAALWHKGRVLFRKMSQTNQEAFLKYWDHRWIGPKTALYFVDLLHHWNPAKQSLDWSAKNFGQSAQRKI